MLCIPLANIDNGLVSVLSCLSAFSLCEFGILSGKSLLADELEIIRDQINKINASEKSWKLQNP